MRKPLLRVKCRPGTSRYSIVGVIPETGAVPILMGFRWNPSLNSPQARLDYAAGSMALPRTEVIVLAKTPNQVLANDPKDMLPPEFAENLVAEPYSFPGDGPWGCGLVSFLLRGLPATTGPMSDKDRLAVQELACYKLFDDLCRPRAACLLRALTGPLNC